MGKPAILKTCAFRSREAEEGLATHFEVHDLPPDGPGRDAVLATVGPRIRGIATNSKGLVDEALLDRLPALEIVSSFSAGREGLAVEAIRARGLKFSSPSEALGADVADLAVTLLLCVVRNILPADRFVRADKWQHGRFGFSNRVGGLKLGIVGLGSIGKAVALRGAAFGMEIAYHGPNAKPEVPYRYFASLHELATWSNALVLSCPGGAETRHIVDADVLAALGPSGWLVNVARGSVVDQEALIAALVENRLAGAGLDVLEGEPAVPPELIASDRVVLTPHYGASTAETKYLQTSIMVEALVAQLGGRRELDQRSPAG